MRLPAILGLAVAVATPAAVAQDDVPELSFLEYLGSWQEGDEEWMLVAEMAAEIDEEAPPATEDADDEHVAASDED